MTLPRTFTPDDVQILRNRLAALPGHREVKPPTSGEEPLRCTSQIRVLKAAIEYVRGQLDSKPVSLRALQKKWVVGNPPILKHLNELDKS